MINDLGVYGQMSWRAEIFPEGKNDVLNHVHPQQTRGSQRGRGLPLSKVPIYTIVSRRGDPDGINERTQGLSKRRGKHFRRQVSNV